MEWLDIVKDLNAGTVGGIAGIAAGHPLDTVKVQLQTSREAGAGVLRTLQRVVGSDGAAGLYRGLLSPIVSNAPINAVVFGVQGQVVRQLQSSTETLSSSQHFLAGSSAGFVQVVFAAPSEHVKIQLQTGAISKENNSFGAAKTIVRKYGTRTLFKGWQVCLLRDVPAFGAYFSGYEATKRALTNGQSENETDLKLMMREALQGWFRGLIRMQQEGPRFFFKGFSATMLRAFPVSAVTFLVYEKTMQFMS
ncbi:unnamed protein product [Peronospora destructor]|uniref:Uncharacterized protein n=1 Tax=Peronospora destructor TaxID=86335 RepID=A0AAV0T0E3_9STRA|nr:unnamed protein product [Peronospora destructor]